MAAVYFDYQEILDNWSVESEQAKADFLDALYEFYGCNDGLYTGLWERYKNDIAEFGRDMVVRRDYKVVDLFALGLES
jgi:hypothetical protein